ncbi:hypothetical protein DFH11DRAFT_1546059 [Phellopilus nigrolimitatus]|nr:hypothetical protein DFH11DRAFT_1546059 [Phellopilus nigrolimitatus]
MAGVREAKRVDGDPGSSIGKTKKGAAEKRVWAKDVSGQAFSLPCSGFSGLQCGAEVDPRDRSFAPAYAQKNTFHVIWNLGGGIRSEHLAPERPRTYERKRRRPTRVWAIRYAFRSGAESAQDTCVAYARPGGIAYLFSTLDSGQNGMNGVVGVRGQLGDDTFVAVLQTEFVCEMTSNQGVYVAEVSEEDVDARFVVANSRFGVDEMG